jgi:putative FmdB family regulatory protein
MPTYSYHCDTGNHDFDIVQRFSDDALTVCPECGGSVRRVIQPVGVVFKGSGWYINDSRKSSSSEGGSSSSGGKKSEKSESASASEKSAEPAKASASSEKGSEKSTAKAAD